MNEYSIQELSDLTGVPRRTIHFYTQQGILPPPQGAGLSTRYQQEHLVRLKLIPYLRRRSLRLDQIRTFLNEQDPSELTQLLLEEQSSTRVAMKSPAAPPPQGMSGIVYNLPGGMTLIVPAETAAKDARRIKEIIKIIQDKFKEKDKHDSAPED
ncbi:MAG TPA: helix-turn-helix domain-containing protein [Anaerolineaceae bacterium]|nr:helix-turn-helix domain-containing protein [Anaerolineaceae bacterium]